MHGLDRPQGYNHGHFPQLELAQIEPSFLRNQRAQRVPTFSRAQTLPIVIRAMIPLQSIVDFLFILSFLVILRALHNHQKRKGLPYPPGPRPLPIIGNLLDIPRESSWLVYTPLAKKYGT